MTISYYDILNVPYTASIHEIRSSFRKMAKWYHPDISSSDHASTKFKLIDQAYKTLGNKELKKEYDEEFFKNISFENDWGYIKIPKSRIEYASSLKSLAKSGLLAQKRLKRKHRLNNFGYDISIPLTPNENKRGVVTRLSLPARGVCDVCYGDDRICYLCEGLGNVSSVEELEIFIHPNVEQNTIIDIDLRKYPPGKLSYFTLSNIKVLINITGE